MTKKRFLLGGTAVLLTLGLAACGTGGTQSGAADPATWQDDIVGSEIEVGVLDAEDDPGYENRQATADAMNADYEGADVKLIFANSQARPGIEQRWRAGDGLDVDYGMFDGTNPNQTVWADDGFLLDLKPYLEQTELEDGTTWLESFSPSALNYMTDPKTGGIYGVPTELSVQVLYYNAKIFRDLDIEPPTTWDQLLEACDQLNAAGIDPIAVTGLFQPYMGMWSDNIWNRTVPYETANAVLARGEGSIKDHPGFLEGLEKLEELVAGGDNLIEGFEGTDFAPAEALFYQEKAGMMVMGNWLIGGIAENAPEGFELGVLPFPTIEGGDGDQGSVLSAAQLVSVNAESANIPLALEWILRNTSVATQTERAEKYGNLSAVLGVPGPTNGEGIEKVIADASSLQPREFGMIGTEAEPFVYSEIARLFFGEQNAQETLDRLDAGLKDIYGN